MRIALTSLLVFPMLSFAYDDFDAETREHCASFGHREGSIRFSRCIQNLSTDSYEDVETFQTEASATMQPAADKRPDTIAKESNRTPSEVWETCSLKLKETDFVNSDYYWKAYNQCIEDHARAPEPGQGLAADQRDTVVSDDTDTDKQDHALCESWGLTVGSEGYAKCRIDMYKLHVEERVLREHLQNNQQQQQQAQAALLEQRRLEAARVEAARRDEQLRLQAMQAALEEEQRAERNRQMIELGTQLMQMGQPRPSFRGRTTCTQNGVFTNCNHW